MKTSVRFFSLILAVLMIASVAISASASDAEKYQKENEQALNLLVKLGVFEGYEDGSLKPDSPVRRDEMAKIIFVFSTTFTDVGAGEVIFTDVPADHWAVDYVSWCSNKGIIHGYGDGRFGPADNVTYDQALKMFCSALGYNDFDAKLWPTNVRTKALKDLNLGYGIDKNGSDIVTRAEIAQLAYNALYTPMAEKGAYGLPVTLARNYWNIVETFDTVIATENVDETKKGYVSLAVEGEKTLEELGLSAYADNAYVLQGVELKLAHRDGDFLFAQVATDFVEDATLTVDDKNDLNPANDKFFINGKEIDTIEGLTAADVPSEEDGFDYKLVAWDYSDNGKYDAFALSYYNAYTVKTINKDTITLELYGTSSTVSFELEFATGTEGLEKDDVVVATALLGHLFVKEVITPVSASVNKYSANKITLEGIGEYKINSKVFNGVELVTVPETIINFDANGNKISHDFYVYNGKVFGFEASAITSADPSDYKFALISYFNESEDPVYDPITQSEQSSYSAVVYIDGKKKTVPVAAENVLDDIDIADAIEAYGKKYTNDGITEVDKKIGKYLLPSNIFVTYTVDENGIYSFKTKDTTNEDYAVIESGATIAYNKAADLYTITEADGTVFTTKADFASGSFFLYTYNKVETGHHVHIDVRGEDAFTEDVAYITTTDDMYVKKNEAEGFWDIVAFVAGEDSFETVVDPYADFRYDARKILYCRYPAAITVDVENKKTYYLHKLQYVTGETIEVVNKELAIEDGATPTEIGYFYIFDEETKNYIKINNSYAQANGVVSVNLYTIEDFLFDNILFTKEDGMFKDGYVMEDGIRLWALTTSEGAIGNLTLNRLTKSLETARENGDTIRVLVFTYVDANGETKVFAMLPEYKYVNENGVYTAYSTTRVIDKFLGTN